MVFGVQRDLQRILLCINADLDGRRLDLSGVSGRGRGRGVHVSDGFNRAGNRFGDVHVQFGDLERTLWRKLFSPKLRGHDVELVRVGQQLSGRGSEHSERRLGDGNG